MTPCSCGKKKENSEAVSPFSFCPFKPAGLDCGTPIRMPLYPRPDFMKWVDRKRYTPIAVKFALLLRGPFNTQVTVAPAATAAAVMV